MYQLVAKAVMREHGLPEEPFRAWSHTWISDILVREEFDLAILDRKQGAITVLHSPFDTRPLSKRLPDIESHRAGINCKKPFRYNEPLDKEWDTPRWVLTTKEIPLAKSEAGLGSWRRFLQSSELKNPTTNNTSVFACCSYCGRGFCINLPPGGSLKHMLGRFFVEVELPHVAG